MAYAPIEDIKQRIGYLPASSFGFANEDSFEIYIQTLIRGASRLIDAECNVEDGHFAENTPDLVRTVAADAVAVFLMKSQKYLQDRENPPFVLTLLEEQKEALKRYKTFKIERG